MTQDFSGEVGTGGRGPVKFIFKSDLNPNQMIHSLICLVFIRGCLAKELRSNGMTLLQYIVYINDLFPICAVQYVLEVFLCVKTCCIASSVCI